VVGVRTLCGGDCVVLECGGISLRASDDLSIEDAGFAKHDVQTSATFGADIQCWRDSASVMYMNDWSSCFHGLSHII
jgi:hypothetical protein